MTTPHTAGDRDRASIQLAASPRRSPLIVEPPSTPIRSVHVEGDDRAGLQSLADQKDFIYRSSDFFDAPSDDEIGATVLSSPPTRNLDNYGDGAAADPSSFPSHLTEHSIMVGEEPDSCVQDRGQEQELREHSPRQDHIAVEETPIHSLRDSVDEFLTQNQYNLSHFPEITDQTSGRFEGDHRPTPSTTKANKVLGAHVLAHEITLHALMRNRDLMDDKILPFTPTDTANFRSSLLPPSLQVPAMREPRSGSASNSHHTGKKVHILPTHINTSARHTSFLKDFVPTPYPFGDDRVHFTESKQQRHYSKPSPSTRQRILSITISNGHRSSVNARSTTLVIPAFNQFSTVREDRHGNTTSQPRPSFFDDEDLFDQLRHSFHRLRGSLRYFSARSLRHIVAHDPNGKCTDAQLQPLNSAPSSTSLASTAPATALTGEDLLRHFRKPRLGRARYRFVRWVYRSTNQAIDMVDPPHEPNEESRDRAERESSLEEAFPRLDFIVDWSVTRISLALSLVLVLSMLGALLWIFLGLNTPATWPPHAGFRGAGDRVGPGILVGIGILLLGLSTLAGWLGISWLAV